MTPDVYFTITNPQGQVITHANDLQEAVNYIRRESTPTTPMRVVVQMSFVYSETLTIYSPMNKRNTNPRTTLMNFKTSAKEATRIREVAAKQGKPTSTLIHETLQKHLK